MGNTSLYNKTIGDFNDGNLGLWNDKFCNMWSDDFTALVPKEDGKKNWVNDIVEKSKTSRVNPHINRMQKLADKVVCYKTSEPMIIGMGLNHPIENGMLFHHTLGVPYLPGSSVKGLVRAWAEQWENVNGDELFRIFGSKNRFKNKNSTENV
ncbi:type III-B CRISPR module RAMP protein Cmr6, partial [Bathymodiolus thermophilus thioautotrophic gill symbiont]